jgi:hypothetical protein
MIFQKSVTFLSHFFFYKQKFTRLKRILLDSDNNIVYLPVNPNSFAVAFLILPNTKSEFSLDSKENLKNSKL